MATLALVPNDTPEPEEPESAVTEADPEEVFSALVLPVVLTQRQIEVLRCVAAGLTNRQVAAKLGLSVYTVETHLRLIYRKLKVSTRGAAIRYAFESGLL